MMIVLSGKVKFIRREKIERIINNGFIFLYDKDKIGDLHSVEKAHRNVDAFIIVLVDHKKEVSPQD